MPSFQKALAEARAAEAQKDTLLTEVLETTQFVSDLNSELAKARSVAIGDERRRPGSSRRAPGPGGAEGDSGADSAGHRPTQ